MKQFKMLQIANIFGVKVWSAKKSDFKKLSVAKSINLFNPSQSELEQAIEQAEKDMFENVICYDLTKSQFEKQAWLYNNKA
jgi:hypothetical protein